MSELQKRKIKQVTGWTSIAVFLVFSVIGIEYEWFFIFFIWAVICTVLVVSCVYCAACEIIYDWNIRGVIEPDELCTYKKWSYRIHDGEFDFIKTACNEDELLTILKIEKVKRPKWY